MSVYDFEVQRIYRYNGLLPMKINYDKIADAIYFSMKKGKVAKTLEMNERLIVDVDKKGNILGIEMLDASTQLPKNSLAGGIPVMITSGAPVVA